MKIHFPGYYPLANGDIDNLLINATIVFDADSLLDLFRMKKEYVESILNVMGNARIKDKLWLPYDVAWLYHRCMNDEILKQIENVNSILSHLTQCKDAVLAPKRFPYFEQYLTNMMQRGIGGIEEACIRQQSELMETLKESEIKDRVDALFRGKIGTAYEDGDLNNIYADGDERYSHSIPPGYMTERNVDNRVLFHDLIVWKQLQKYSKDQAKDVLLITGNVRKDWYYIVKNRIVSPRNELINEFQKETTHHFYCVSMRQFIEKSCDKFGVILNNYQNLLSQLVENIEYASVDENYVGSNSYQSTNEGNSI